MQLNKQAHNSHSKHHKHSQKKLIGPKFWNKLISEEGQKLGCESFDMSRAFA